MSRVHFTKNEMPLCNSVGLAAPFVHCSVTHLQQPVVCPWTTREGQPPSEGGVSPPEGSVYPPEGGVSISEGVSLLRLC